MPKRKLEDDECFRLAREQLEVHLLPELASIILDEYMPIQHALTVEYNNPSVHEEHTIQFSCGEDCKTLSAPNMLAMRREDSKLLQFDLKSVVFVNEEAAIKPKRIRFQNQSGDWIDAYATETVAITSNLFPDTKCQGPCVDSVVKLAFSETLKYYSKHVQSPF